MESSDPPAATSTHRLLTLGVIAGPIYLAVGLAQALLRSGFDLRRHPLSVLENGPGGWIQVANFVVVGAMVIAAAVGIQRALGSSSRAVSWLLGAFGASMIAAAVFWADPMDGFPIGTPKGPPKSISTRGLLHFAAGGLGFISLGVSCLFAGKAMSRRNARSLARLSSISGLVILAGFFGGMAIPNSSPVLGIWIAVVVGWAWLSSISRHLSHQM